MTITAQFSNPNTEVTLQVNGLDFEGNTVETDSEGNASWEVPFGGDDLKFKDIGGSLLSLTSSNGFTRISI